MKEKRFCTTLLHRVLLRALLTSRKKDERKHVETSSWTPLSWFISFLHHTESLTEHVETFLHVFRKWSFASTRGQMQVHAQKTDWKTIWKKWKTSVPRAETLFIDAIFAVLTQTPVNTEEWEKWWRQWQKLGSGDEHQINRSMQRHSSLTSFSQSWLQL